MLRNVFRAMTRLGVASMIVALAATLLVACSAEREAHPVTRAEAEQVLQALAGRAQAEDMAGLCAEARAPEPTCRVQFALAGGPDSFPVRPPQVIASTAIEPNEVSTLPGQVLTICGEDGLGRRYAGNLLVYRPADEFVVPYPVFWLGISISSVEPDVTPTTTTDPGRLMRQCEAAGAFS